MMEHKRLVQKLVQKQKELDVANKLIIKLKKANLPAILTLKTKNQLSFTKVYKTKNCLIGF